MHLCGIKLKKKVLPLVRTHSHENRRLLVFTQERPFNLLYFQDTYKLHTKNLSQYQATALHHRGLYRLFFILRSCLDFKSLCTYIKHLYIHLGI